MHYPPLFLSPLTPYPISHCIRVIQRNSSNRKYIYLDILRNGSGDGGSWLVQNLHNIPAGWKPREELMLQSPKTIWRQNFFFFSVFLRPSTDWMRPIHIMEHNLLYSKPTDLNVNNVTYNKHNKNAFDENRVPWHSQHAKLIITVTKFCWFWPLNISGWFFLLCCHCLTLGLCSSHLIQKIFTYVTDTGCLLYTSDAADE